MKSIPQNHLTHQAFTLIELLVVVTIIATLAALLVPALQNARVKSKTVQCSSNMREVGKSLLNYLGDNNGFIPKGSNWANQLTNYMSSPNNSNSAVFYCSLATKANYGVGGDGKGQFANQQWVDGTSWPATPQTIGGVTYGTNIFNGQVWANGVPISMIPSSSRTAFLSEMAVNTGANANSSSGTFSGWATNYPNSLSAPASNHRNDGKAANGDGPINYLYLDGHVQTFLVWPGPGEFVPK